MRRSLWLPLGLAALIFAVVVSGQVGITGEQWASGVSGAVARVRSAAWPALAGAALALWFATRERALGFYAMGLALAGAGELIRLFGGWALAAWLYPLQICGLALAVIAWSGGDRHAPGHRMLLGLTAALTALFSLYLLTPNIHGGSVYLAAALTALQAAYYALLGARAWLGYKAAGVRPLLFLGAQAGAQGIFALHGVLVMLWPLRPQFLEPLLLELLLIVNLIAAASVIWSAAVKPEAEES